MASSDWRITAGRTRIAHKSRTFLTFSRSEKEYAGEAAISPERSQLANWRAVRCRILSKSARLYTSVHKSCACSAQVRPRRHYPKLAVGNATANSCGNLWRTWLIYMQRKWCSLFPTPEEDLVALSARLSFPNPSLVYTTTAAWYSSYVPLKSVILWSLSKCQMRVATSSIKS